MSKYSPAQGPFYPLPPNDLPAVFVQIPAHENRVLLEVLFVPRSENTLDDDRGFHIRPELNAGLSVDYHQQYLAKNPDRYCGMGGYRAPYAKAVYG